ncbi:MAG: GntR family transcriptional regulator [Gaiella sp.]|nr:GntR family transcriptional regulator [Gaiella sp.]
MSHAFTQTVDGGGRATLVDLATQALRHDLLTGELPPDSRIHLGETAARLQMSAIPVREALRTLATEGLVIALPHRGYRVPDVSLADLEDIYRLRLVLDPMAVTLAVPNLSDADIERASRALESLADALEAEDWLRMREANHEFHFVCYEAAQAPRLLKLVSMLWENSERYQRLASPVRGTPKQRVEEHRRILRALRARDAERAATLTYEHLNRTYEMARERLGETA